jgi:diacylglycerol kinase family enzyme
MRSLQKKLRQGFEYRAMPGPGAGEEMAVKAIREGFRTIVAAGGDGTIHEIANGILRSSERAVELGVWPIGSANDYAFALNLDRTWLIPAAQWKFRSVDAGWVETEDGRGRYFVNGMGVGFNAAVTVEARKIRWLRGVPLYALGILQAMRRQFVSPKLHVAFDDVRRDEPTLALSISVGKREGGFPLTPNAELDDGQFDYLQAGPLTRWELLRQLPNMVAGNIPRNHPKIWPGRCRSVAIKAEEPLRVHVDGEFLCHPEDGQRHFQVKLFPQALRVQTGSPP